jgi:hypothetical protein
MTTKRPVPQVILQESLRAGGVKWDCRAAVLRGERIIDEHWVFITAMEGSVTLGEVESVLSILVQAGLWIRAEGTCTTICQVQNSATGRSRPRIRVILIFPVGLERNDLVIGGIDELWTTSPLDLSVVLENFKKWHT